VAEGLLEPYLRAIRVEVWAKTMLLDQRDEIG